MKVILAQDVPKLGSSGETIDVKDGYARNFLIPRKLVLAYNPQNLKIVEDKKKKREVEAKRTKDEALALADKISNASCTIAVKVIEEDRLFGSVTQEMIQKAYETEGINIDKKTIEIEEPIKKLGIYQIPIKLHPEVTASGKVWVVKE